MIGEFRNVLAQDIIDITIQMENAQSPYMQYKLQKEVEFKTLVKTEFYLATPGSYKEYKNPTQL